MGDLTKNFDIDEFKCKCGCSLVEVKKRLVDALQKLRDLAGRPVIITSGFRCPNYNHAVGGVRCSLHLMGIAADVQIPGLSLSEICKMAESVPEFGGIGLYPPWVDRHGKHRGNFVHLDVRYQVARWGKIKGRFVSFQEALNHGEMEGP